MKRKQFTFYRSFWESMKKLPTNKEKLQFFEMLCDYALDETWPDLETKKPSAATAFLLVQPTLEAAHAKSKNMTKVNRAFPLSDWDDCH